VDNKQKHFAALLVDFENLYYFIKNRPGYDGHDTMGVIVRLVQALRSHLETEYKKTTISLDAFADFERIEEEAQGDLYLPGFDTRNVLGTDNKNAADMKICIDAMEILYTRPEISKRKAKIVRVVGFQGSTSGDLRTTLGQPILHRRPAVSLPTGAGRQADHGGVHNGNGSHANSGSSRHCPCKSRPGCSAYVREVARRIRQNRLDRGFQALPQQIRGLDVAVPEQTSGRDP
jgi:hypothetical protein